MNSKSINNGIQLRFAREYRGYSQSNLCKEIKGLSQSNLSKFENGFTGIIYEPKLIEIMKFLNFPIKFLDVRISEPYTSWNL